MFDYSVYKNLVDENLLRFFPNIEKESNILKEAMEYSLTAGGKRLRPVLLLASCDFAGGDVKDAIPYACALEYIHTYSLIHDDLPAMDNDELRRGIPTNHKVYGEAIAILAGDGLLNAAFEMMIEDIKSRNDKEEDTDKYIEAMRIISKAAGPEGMIAGQTADIIAEELPPSEEFLTYIHKNKTSKMIIAAVEAGVTIGNTDENLKSDFINYAENLGLAFQIADDILDETGEEQLLGKSIGKDEAENKMTYVSLYGIEKSKSKLKEVSALARDVIKNYEHVDFFTNLVDELEKRKH